MNMPHFDNSLSVKSTLPEVCDGFMKCVLANTDGSKSQKELSQRNGSKNGIPGIAALRNDVARRHHMVPQCERTDICSTHPERPDFPKAAKCRGLVWPESHKHK